MGYGVGSEVAEVTVGTGLMTFGLSLLEDLATHPPGVAVLQVVSVLFAERYVGADTTVQVVVGIGCQKRP